MLKTRAELNALQEKSLKQLNNIEQRILVCAGTGCVASGSLKIFELLNKLISENPQLKAKAQLVEEVPHPEVTAHVSGCHGFCEMGPLVRIEPRGTLYCKVKPEDVQEIFEEHILNGRLVSRLHYHENSVPIETQDQIPFYSNQMRVSLARCGRVDPTEIDDFIAHDGYQAIAKALFEMTPEQALEEVLASGLRGRGGAGFPAGRKWLFAKQAKGDKKYLICNGDEGDPGAFMDRSVMEGDPFRILEGMMLASYAIGADEGYIYVRAEYPLAVSRLRNAIEKATEYGLLGENILGSGFNFKINIKEGAGAFVCGEETALISSIEGKRGMPRPRPPFPAVSGLFGCPTVLNNVETLANLSDIILNGADWFKNLGTSTSTGTKTFALAGQISHTGLVEVPMGATLRKVVFDIGGGLRNNKEFKAVQIGGPSGGCLTKEHLDLPLDFDSLQKVGAMMGSGGLVVMGDDTCMVETAKFFMTFIQNESCGKCVPCREGTKRMLEILTKITEGKGTEADIDLLEELAEIVQDGAMCGLGKTAPNPVITTLRYFRDEYLAHVRDKICPAGACKDLLNYWIDPETCKGCGLCKKLCPADAISGEKKQPHEIDMDKCIKCGTCVSKCKFGSILTK